MAKKPQTGRGASKLFLGAPLTVIGFTANTVVEICNFSDKHLPNDLGIEYGIKKSKKFNKLVSESTEFTVTALSKELEALAKAIK